MRIYSTVLSPALWGLILAQASLEEECLEQALLEIAEAGEQIARAGRQIEAELRSREVTG